jgi:hypothetical protein
MWFYIPAAVFVVLLTVSVVRSNLFRHWRQGSDPGQMGTNVSRGVYNDTNDLTRRRD